MKVSNAKKTMKVCIGFHNIEILADNFKKYIIKQTPNRNDLQRFELYKKEPDEIQCAVSL